MSLQIGLSDLTSSEREKVMKDLVVKLEDGNKFYPYLVQGDQVYLPLHYAVTELKLQPSEAEYAKVEYKHSIVLRDYQEETKKEILRMFKEQRTGIISYATGQGKTITALSIMAELGLKTAIVYHRETILDAWEEELKEYFPNCRYTVITDSVQGTSDNDVFLVSNIILNKLPFDFFYDIGFLIVDEVHAFYTELNMKAISHIQPLYSLALSATPYERNDGYEEILDYFFGLDRMSKDLYVEHDVYQYKTGIKPEIKKNKRGDLDWGTVLNSQAENVERNETILKMVKFFKDRTILLICKRKSQAQYLYDRLLEMEENVDKLFGTTSKSKKKAKYNKNCRVLVVTYSKSGVGFNNKNLDMMIICGDVEGYFAQYFGRVVRRPDVRPIIVDIVDNFHPLYTHFETRKEYYLKVGGKIKNFHFQFPEFFKEEEEEDDGGIVLVD